MLGLLILGCGWEGTECSLPFLLENTMNGIPHPRTGQSYRQMLDYSTCLVIGALVRQVTTLTEAVAALRAHVDNVTQTPLQDDPLDVPHLEEITLRLHAELISTATRLELSYRYVQRARQAIDSEIAKSRDVSRETDGFLLGPDEVTVRS